MRTQLILLICALFCTQFVNAQTEKSKLITLVPINFQLRASEDLDNATRNANICNNKSALITPQPETGKIKLVGNFKNYVFGGNFIFTDYEKITVEIENPKTKEIIKKIKIDEGKPLYGLDGDWYVFDTNTQSVIFSIQFSKGNVVKEAGERTDDVREILSCLGVK